MKFRLRHTLAAALAAMALPALAAHDDWGSHGPVEIGTFHDAAGAISDFFTFTLGATSSLSATAVANNNSAALKLTDGSVSLYRDVTGPDQLVGSFSFDGTTGDLAHSFSALVAGSYYYLVTGSATGHAGGLYQLSSVLGESAPVPEPQSAALLLAGLGAIGLMARRRGSRAS